MVNNRCCIILCSTVLTGGTLYWMLLVAEMALHGRMTVNSELLKMWSLPNSRYYTDICLAWLRKFMKHLENRWYLGWDFNLKPPEQKWGVLPTQLWHSATCQCCSFFVFKWVMSQVTKSISLFLLRSDHQ